jgi:predicted MFS family arabinose efflux permease
MPSTDATPFWRPALAGACAPCSGIGLARFAYVPLFPAMVAAGWVDGAGAGALGAANMTGYLIGALTGRPLAMRLGTARTLDLGMALVVLSFVLCAVNLGLWWFMPWRLLAGVAGGILMALAGPATQARVVPERRGQAGGIVIGGVGIGIATASVTVPALVGQGLAMAWLGLAAIVLGLWAFAHPRWPDAPIGPGPGASGARPRAALVVLSYGLSGGGLVPSMIYMADLAVRGRGLPLAYASGIWLLFGLGGLCGTLSSGTAADKLGGTRSYRLWLLIQVVALALCLPRWPWLLVPAALVSGFAALGVTAVVLALARERAGAAAGAVWARTTISFAIAQSVVAFGMAKLFALTGESHLAIFSAGLVLSLAALGVALAERK